MNSFKVLFLLALSGSIIGCTTVASQQDEIWPTGNRAQIHVDLARIYLERGRADTAKEEFNKALSIDARSDQALHGLGLIEAQALNFEKAKNLMLQALILNSNNLTAAGDYGILLCQSGNTEEGISRLEQTLAKGKKSNTVGINLALGYCYQWAKRPQLAAEALGRALELNPLLPQALVAMAQARYDQNQALSARGFIQRYFSTNTISSKALLLGAQIENSLGNTKSQNDYTKALKKRYPRSKAWEQAQKEFN